MAAIGEALGASVATIARDLDEALADIPQESADRYRTWATLRLKRLLQQVYPTAVGNIPHQAGCRCDGCVKTNGAGQVPPEVRAQMVMAKMVAWEKARSITLDIADLNGARAMVPEELIIHADTKPADQLGDVMREVFGKKPALPAHLVKQDGASEPPKDVEAQEPDGPTN